MILRWHEANAWYFEQSKLTGAEYFNYVINLTKRYGYEFGNAIAGHIVGRYPHEQPDDPNDPCLDVHPRIIIPTYFSQTSLKQKALDTGASVC
jgi:hypothetical protein